MIRPYHTVTHPGRTVANEFASMIRPYHTVTHTVTHPGRTVANEFASMIRPYHYGCLSNRHGMTLGTGASTRLRRMKYKVERTK